MDVNTYEYLSQAFRAVAAERRKGGITPVRLMNLMQNMLDYTANTFSAQALQIAGKADIVGGKVPMSQLPDGLDDMQEYPSRSDFPAAGVDNILYMALDTGKMYRWAGTTYGEVSSNLALGETSSTAYPGNKGKANADAIAILQSLMDTFEEDLTGKADVEHTHGISDITGLLNALNAKANSNHTHAMEDITQLNDVLEDLVAATVEGLQVEQTSEACVIHVINTGGTETTGGSMQPASLDRVGVMTPTMYTQLLAVDDKAERNHTHSMADVSNLESVITTINNNLEATVNTANSNSESINMLREQMQGRNVCKVFDTRTDADGWMSDPISRRQLLVGSFIYIKNQSEDDYMVEEVLDSPDTSGTNPTGFYYKVSDVQRNLPSLVGYAETAADNIFTGANTFQGDVEFDGNILFRGQDQHWGEIGFHNVNSSNAASTTIDSAGVRTAIGSRYVTYRGGNDEYGVGATKISRDPFSGTITEESSKLKYDELEFIDSAGTVVLTPANIRNLLSLWNKLGENIGALNVTELLVSYSMPGTFDDLKNAVKMYMTDGTNYREVHIMNLVDETIPYGSLYYDDIVDNHVKRFMYSITEVNGVISTSAPTVYTLS